MTVSLAAADFSTRDSRFDLGQVFCHQLRTSSFRETYRALIKRHREKPIDVIHDHGQWLPLNLATAVFASRFKIPRIVSPHGMLATEAIQHRSLKKIMAWRLYAKWCFRQSAIVHAASDREIEGLEKFRPNQTERIAIGIMPYADQAALVSRFREPVIAFLGRVHPIKGIHELLSAWSTVAASNWSLEIAGFDEQQFFTSTKLPERVKYRGPLNHEQKYELLSRASVLAFPSHSENFGLTVSEALYSGTPVIASQNTPWKVLDDRNLGWWIPLSISDLTKSLQRATEMNYDQLRTMGVAASKFAKAELLWPNLMDKYYAMYERAININL